ncbi:MAG: DUF2330 domain-containing protein [Deltaproteobacteria bacterium]|nr:DUF2330 domain-containing protein [Deltaproteobacteria bacterium]
MKSPVALAAFAALVHVVAPATAHACGGTFCDGATAGPPMPVDQTGENILFVQDGPAMEAHIQIQYQGEPQRFAWVVPIPAVPEFRVGSDLLFRELLRASAPAYVAQRRLGDTCAEDMIPYLLLSPALLAVPLVALALAPWLLVALAPAGCALSEDLTAFPPDAGASSTVVWRDSVGAFDITVLQSSRAEEVLQWLRDNQYLVPPSTEPLIRQYTEENSLFAAIKLVSTAAVDEIHPIVLRYEYGVPCVPLRLTAVAAAMDMGVRVFFLGNARVVPRTYRHVEVNPVRVDWLNAGANYRDVVSRAVDDPNAGGQGFVTEYAGASSVVQRASFAWWSLTLTQVGSTPAGVLADLGRSSLLSCQGTAIPPPNVTGVTPDGSCTFYHPLLRGLLLDYLPPPTGIAESDYWGNPGAFPVPAAWDHVAFWHDFDDRVQRPADRAAALVATRPYLTRLFTTISPDEMTVDPEFHERADLPAVANLRTATVRAHCDGTQRVDLPDGRGVETRVDGGWPAFDDAMPWALRVDDIPQQGDIVPLTENEAAVDARLARWNDSQRPVQARGRCTCAQPRADFPLAAALLALVVVGRRRRRGC